MCTIIVIILHVGMIAWMVGCAGVEVCCNGCQSGLMASSWLAGKAGRMVLCAGRGCPSERQSSLAKVLLGASRGLVVC